MIDYGKTLLCSQTSIPGLTLWELPVHGDNRGWFKENWRRDKMISAGLPDFGPVQNNVSFNDKVGTTRGIHAEPWDKFVSVAHGRVFGAWVDLRAGPNFGCVFTAELDPSRAVFVPRGVGNAFQTLESQTTYTYLVNDHYSTSAVYTSLNLADETIAIKWPIDLGRAEVSEKDRNHPPLRDICPVAKGKVLVLGANGQLGTAIRQIYAGESDIEFASRDDIDIESDDLESARRWRDYTTIINAAAHTAVDAAETPQGRVDAWRANVAAVASLARIAGSHGITLVHISSDYVFDGTGMQPYTEEAAISPLSVYGQTKAAGDQIISTLLRHYIIRTSWVIGSGPNFVRTMACLAQREVNPTVVEDQRGRLTFATELARAIRHLVDERAPYGTYNVTGAGEPQSWADIARRVFGLAGHDPARVVGVTTDEYAAAKNGSAAPRPSYSVLDLSKIESTGFVARDAEIMLREYLERLAAQG